MKEFAMKHPILTFLIADALIGGVVSIVRALSGNPLVCYNVEDTEEESEEIEEKKEDEPDEPSGDIQ